MAKQPTQSPPIQAVPTRADLSRALAIFAEKVADQPDALTDTNVREMSLPLLGLRDLYVCGSSEDRVLAFTVNDKKPASALTAHECIAVSAFFMRMGALLQEPK